MALAVTTVRADEDLRRIDAWWREHHGHGHSLLLDELAAAFSLLSRWPEAGRLYRNARILGLRRVLLRASKYHVYYLLHEDRVIVLTVWAAVRGRDPKLP